jgi:hypothetical protein
VTCPHCQQAAPFQGYRAKTPLSILGPVPCRRAYYYCGRCGHGLCPWDEAVGLSPRRLTPAAEQLVALAGTLSESFVQAAEVLPRLAGLRLGESTVERTTEDAGRRAGEALAAGDPLGAARPWRWHRDARGRTCAYLGIDATGVAQQGSGAGAAPGRMPYVAMVYNPVPACGGGRMQARHLAGLDELDELGPQLQRQAAQVGMEAAEVWVGLTDGGSGLEGFLQRNFNRPDLVLILDFWHAAEDLRELARLCHPRDEAAAQAWCHALKHHGGAACWRDCGRCRRRGGRLRRGPPGALPGPRRGLGAAARGAGVPGAARRAPGLRRAGAPGGRRGRRRAAGAGRAHPVRFGHEPAGGGGAPGCRRGGPALAPTPRPVRRGRGEPGVPRRDQGAGRRGPGALELTDKTWDGFFSQARSASEERTSFASASAL